jgi:3-hydroxyisobutyrate dehydrogenase
MARVAFIGLGRMGLGMAGRLLAAGHELHVYNRNSARAADLIARGATCHETPRAACERAEVVIGMVSDDEASRAVWLGSNGVLAAPLAPGVLAVECSTLSHDWVITLGSEASARGLRYLDAPVTGLPDMAAAGALTLLTGGDPAHLTAAQPVLSELATRILHFGAIGAGTAYKLLVNLLGAVQIASAAETMALAERAGLDTKGVADALSSGQAASPQVVRNTRRIALGEHDQDVLFTPALRLKDVDYALRLARKLGMGAPFGALAAGMFRELCELGHVHCNESRIIEVARRQRPRELDESGSPGART